MTLRVAVAALGLLLLAPWAGGANAAPRVEPTRAALDLVRTLPAKAMGVDRVGHLWVWTQAGAVELISPAGSRLERLRPDDLWLLDADTEWGVAGLFAGGNELRWLRWDGNVSAAFRLSGPAADVCWLGRGTVAITPKMTPHRVEIWDLKTQRLERTLGKEEPLQLGVGAKRLRAVVLRYDHTRGHLYTLESHTGELQVLSLNGDLLWTAHLENPRRAETDAWLLGMDRQAREKGEVQSPTLYTLRLSLDALGEPWVVQGKDDGTQTILLAKLSPQGTKTREIRGIQCPSFTFTVWGGWLVSYGYSPSGAVCADFKEVVS